MQDAGTSAWLGLAAQPDVEQPAPEAVPDWLRDLGTDESAGEPGPTPFSFSDVQSDEATGDTPDWLRGLDAQSTSSDAGDDLPAWLRPDSAAGAESVSSEGDTEAVPDWLRDLDVQSPPTELPAEASTSAWQPAEPTPTDSDADAGLPDWLRAEVIPADAQPPASSDTGFDWLTQPEAPQPPADSGTDSDTELPDWLQAGTSAAPEQSAEASDWLPQPETPSPAETSAPEAEQPSDDAAGAGVPDWLRSTSMDEVRQIMADDDLGNVQPFTFEGEPSSGGTDMSSSDVPAWLQADTDSSDETPSWLDSFTSSPAEPPAPSSTEMPAWLQQGAADEHADAQAEDSSTEELDTADALPAWLQAETGEPSSAEPAGSTDDVPDWLQAQAGEPSGTESAGEVPAWLQAEANEPPHPELTEAGEIPAWLQAEASAPPHPESTEAGEIPAWLQAETGEPSQTTGARDDVPDWLRGEVSDSPTTEETPAWLSTESAEAPAAPTTDDDVPPWVRDQTGGADAVALPSWLQGADADVPTPPKVPAAPEAPAEDVPAWLSAEPTDSVAPEAPETSGLFFDDDEPDTTSGSEFLREADLPAWLRPQQPAAERTAEIDRRDARALDWLSRIGGVEDEPVSVPAEEAPRLQPPAPPVRSQAYLDSVALLERLAARPIPEAAPLPEEVAERRWLRGGSERVLYLVLLVALVAALLVPSLVASLQVPPIVPSAQPLFEQLDQLTEQDVMLVGYEWDARRISELRPLERAVMGHLLEKKVKLVIVSTDPQGTLVAYDLRERLAAAGYERGGLDYIWLGYKPGGEVALRALAQDVPGALASDFYGDNANISPLAEGFRTDRPLTSLQAFSGVLVLADEALDVQGWMEQIHTSIPETPITFLLPAEAAPSTQPYMRQPNVFSVAGRSGALAYENLRGVPANDARIAQEFGQQRLGLLVFAVLLLAGIVVGGGAAAVKRGGNAS